MFKTRIFLFVAAAALVVVLFLLPKSVVDNDPKSVGEKSSEPTTPSAEDPHTAEFNSDQTDLIDKLNDQLAHSDDFEKSLIFADSLAKLYISLNKYDSAARFFELIAEKVPTVGNWLMAGNTYYEAFGFAMDAARRSSLAEKAKVYFIKILEAQPENLDIKNKLAMTYVSSPNPMQGIMMLREILQQDPQNEQALFNLGVLSMQSGQYDKAVERFSNLAKLYPDNTQAQFFLGVSYLETGKKDKAKEQFLLVKSLDDDPAVQATVDSYLENI
ncbi:tetratricopeptide repeat protein [Fulvivirga sp. M361]|uniref:tetratricopeptide repeat protein n=1 Tax=Fulvivirga sp. M361 TaxID=2594266 RepID=UPI00117A26AC|nr:tetratricopeptide repeat protein [Fulvivirga sp. M361]TRX58396.1 tetratricopeptide repeat protein [Fulvivirga sp. M361]